MLSTLQKKLYDGIDLTSDEAKIIFDEVMTGKVDDIIISSLLTALKIKEETADEIAGACKSILNKATNFNRPDYHFGDIVGTGGDPYNTINVSSMSAIVAGACGAKVCKHGNRKVSSSSGSADVLSALGLNLDASPEHSRLLLDTVGVCFIMAPNYHRAIKYVMPVRQTLKTRTIFNIIGPLINPARPDYIVNGVYDKRLLHTIGQAHNTLGVKRATIVHGSGLDEVALHGTTDVVELNNGIFEKYTLSPSDFGLAPQSLDTIEGGNVAYNSSVARAVFDGTAKDEHKNIVAVNVAMYLRTAGIEKNLKKGVEIALNTINNGSCLKILERLNK